MACGCKRQIQKPEVQILQKTISSFIGKTPNDLYVKLGMPAKYEAIVDDKSNITSAKITYNYVYNFNQGVYDCQVYYFTNKEQNKIIKYMIKFTYTKKTYKNDNIACKHNL